MELSTFWSAKAIFRKCWKLCTKHPQLSQFWRFRICFFTIISVFIVEKDWWAKWGTPIHQKKNQFILVQSLVNISMEKVLKIRPISLSHLAVRNAQILCESIWPAPPLLWMTALKYLFHIENRVAKIYQLKLNYLFLHFS